MSGTSSMATNESDSASGSPSQSTPLQLLSDVKIVAFTQFLLGPSAVQFLADMGADVIKIEEPNKGPHERRWSGAESWLGDTSTFFLLAHRNVRSVALDLKQPAAVDVARRLCRDADVVIVNFRPGVMERLGLSYETLAVDHPGLIYAVASGFGTTGPYAGLPGQDLLLQAMTGLAAATGRATEHPVAAGAAVVDQHAASLLAMGVLGALHHRDRTGQGQRVDVTMVQAALDLQIEPVTYHANGSDLARPSVPLGSSFHEAPYGFYRTADGFVALSLSPIAAISAALGNPPELAEWLDQADAWPHREEIYTALAPLLSDLNTHDLMTVLRDQGIWCQPVNDYTAVHTDPVVTSLDPWMDVDHPTAGRVRLLRHPIRYGSGEATMRRVPPQLGEHTAEVLAEVGYSAEEISDLAQTKVLRVPNAEHTNGGQQ